jgi:tetratricopeptide (TPR) repeat protein
MTKRKAVQEEPIDSLATREPEIAARPDSLAALVDTGWLHLGRGEIAQALEAFEKAASLDHRSIDARYGLGAAARLKGDQERAKQAFQRVVEISETGADAVRGMMMGRLARWALKEMEKWVL